MTEPLHVAYERVCKKHPELRYSDLDGQLVVKTGRWTSVDPETNYCFLDRQAEALIESACVRWLLMNAEIPRELHMREERSEPTSYLVVFGFRKFIGPTLAHALLAACEAQEKRA